MNQSGMRIRLIAILYILSFTISIFIFSRIMSKVTIDFECTSYAHSTVLGSDVYYAQNTKSGGVIFKLDTKGKVQKMFLSKELDEDRVLDISAYNDSIYAVFSTYSDLVDENNQDAFVTKAYYDIICFDKDLEPTLITPKFEFEEGMIFKELTAEKGGIYMTALSSNGSSAKVYRVNPAQLLELNMKTDEKTRVETIWNKKASDGRFYSDACYQDGQLYIRTDADAPVGVFETDSFIKDIVSNIKLTTAQVMRLYAAYIFGYIAILLIWFVLLYFIVKLILDRNRSFYFILIAETVLFVITLTGSITIVNNYYGAKAIEHSRFAVTSLIGLADAAGLKENINYTDENIYDSSRYQEIKNSLCEFVTRDGNSSIFYDVLVYSIQDGYVCASGSGRNKQQITEIFGQKLSGLSMDIFRGNPYTAVDFTVEGQDYRAVAVETSQNAPKYALIGIINSTTLDKSVFVKNRGILILFMTIYALGSALVVYVWRLYLKDIAALEHALIIAAEGGKFPERPKKVGADVKEMWDSVTEINKKLEENEYIKIRILEAYYRFAPKNVERVLFKNSILEVKSGNSSSIKGTVAMMGIDTGKGTTGKLDAILDMIGEYQKEHDCMIVGKAPDLSLLEMLFMETDMATVRFMINLYIHNIKTVGNAMFSTVLYFDDCIFSVMGGSEEATTYLYSEDSELKKNIVGFALKLKLGLIITEAVKERENILIPLRFVGYAKGVDNKVPLKLYEVLDVYPALLRAERISTLEKYKDALRCFYERDFYIARTKFSDILKETPDDELVRWYVFESERFLNESVEGDKHKYIHF